MEDVEMLEDMCAALIESYYQAIEVNYKMAWGRYRLYALYMHSTNEVRLFFRGRYLGSFSCFEPFTKEYAKQYILRGMMLA